MRYKLNELDADSTDAFTKIFDTSHIETEQYYLNILLKDLKPIVSDLRNSHMKNSNTASDIDYQSMVKKDEIRSYKPQLACMLYYIQAA